MPKSKPPGAPLLVWRGGHPYCERFGDYYYSQLNGQAECQHIFVDGNALLERWPNSTRFRIGELGFGTGLNLLETWRLWRANRRPDQTLTFTSVEAYPLDIEAAETALACWPDLAPLAQTLLSNWSQLGAQTIELDPQTTLMVVQEHVPSAIEKFPRHIHAWYLDGFSPAQNPEMWSLPLMQAVFSKTGEGGTFASYTAAGWVRRHLKEAGFIVEKRKGFGTKRDMISGIKPTSGSVK